MRIITMMFLSFCCACGTSNQKQEESVIYVAWKDHWEKPHEKDSILKMEWVHPRFKQCLRDQDIVVFTGSFLSDTTGRVKFKNLGDINGDFVNDSIMAVPEMFATIDSRYEEGVSIIFTDSTIPRMKVDQVCMDVNNVFVVGDIDEDEQSELGQYYTSCASRFKRIDLMSLHEDKWISYGAVTFDTQFDLPPKEQRIRKTGKGKFEMREVTDSANIKIDRWIAFELK